MPVSLALLCYLIHEKSLHLPISLGNLHQVSGIEAENNLNGIELKNFSLLIPSKCPNFWNPKTLLLLGEHACLLYLARYLGGQKETTSFHSWGSLSPGDQTPVVTHASRFHATRTLDRWSMRNLDILFRAPVGHKNAA